MKKRDFKGEFSIDDKKLNCTEHAASAIRLQLSELLFFTAELLSVYGFANRHKMHKEILHSVENDDVIGLKSDHGHAKTHLTKFSYLQTHSSLITSHMCFHSSCVFYL